MSGNVSLVAPNILYGYFALPNANGFIQRQTGNFASYDTLQLEFLPEPSRLALFGAGLLGLWMLYWPRGRATRTEARYSGSPSLRESSRSSSRRFGSGAAGVKNFSFSRSFTTAGSRWKGVP